MADEQAGGPVPGAGQTTVGEDTRKLEKSEAGFREDQGIANLRCGDCRFFESGSCQIVEGSVDEDDVCDLFEPNFKDGNMTAEEATESRQKPLSALEMFITRVSEDKKSGERRWYATTSGTKTDLYGEKMSVALFKDFIERIENGHKPPQPFISEAWNGGMPYLGVAHYLDLNGAGIAGPTTSIWVDGNILKAKGTFSTDENGDPTPLADAAFKAIQEDIATKRDDNERVRISIAFIDWGHNHGNGQVFERKSLADQCMLCEAGVGDKEYTAGHLVHFALTRRPAYPETSIVALEERSMSKRRQDAASIIGDELADELENRSKKLIGRSADGVEEVAPGAIVVKDESRVEEPLGGATSFDEAEAFLTKSAGDDVLLDSWEILSGVLTNIAGVERGAQIREVVRDFQSTIDRQTAQAVLEIREMLGGESVAETVERQVPPQFRKDKKKKDEDYDKESPREEMIEDEVEEEEMEEDRGDEEDEEMKKKKMKEKSHPLDDAIATLRESFDSAMGMQGDPGEKLGLIQESFNTLGDEIRRMVEEQSASAPVDAASINRTVNEAVEKAMGPVNAQLQAIAKALEKPVERSGGEVPSRRAIRMPPSSVPSTKPVTRSVQDPPSEENPTPKLRSLVRKSTVGYEQGRTR